MSVVSRKLKLLSSTSSSSSLSNCFFFYLLHIIQAKTAATMVATINTHSSTIRTTRRVSFLSLILTSIEWTWLLAYMKLILIVLLPEKLFCGIRSCRGWIS